jgi:hypothetical protein
MECSQTSQTHVDLWQRVVWGEKGIAPRCHTCVLDVTNTLLLVGRSDLWLCDESDEYTYVCNEEFH